MTGKELVKRAVFFEGPERIPRDLPEPWGSDFKVVGLLPDPDWEPREEGEDEWGCVWEKDPEGRTMGQVVKHPLKDYSMLDDYPFPDFTKDARYERMREVVQGNTEEKFVLAGIPFSLMHRLEYMRGHVEAWTDPYENPEGLERLLDIFADKAIEIVDKMAEVGVDGFMSPDDLGWQDRLMVSPEIFRTFFKPRYKRVYSHAMKKGVLPFLHSCGYIIDIVGDLIEADLKVIQMDQQENMGVDNLAERYGGKICFYCPVDIQKTMIHGTLDEIREYAKKLIMAFGR